jgi:hypothetical protein
MKMATDMLNLIELLCNDYPSAATAAEVVGSIFMVVRDLPPSDQAEFLKKWLDPYDIAKIVQALDAMLQKYNGFHEIVGFCLGAVTVYNSAGRSGVLRGDEVVSGQFVVDLARALRPLAPRLNRQESKPCPTENDGLQ